MTVRACGNQRMSTRDHAAPVCGAALLLLCVMWCHPMVAAACPMCFNGDGTNTNAYVFGSLFMMFVPVTAIGSLVYWMHRRIKAQDARDARDLHDNHAHPAGHDALAAQPSRASDLTALRIVSRRE
jgi:hypothetical protein